MIRKTNAILPLLLASALRADAAIIGFLETPDGFASQIGNVQGWVYTTTPGAELIQPFDVLIDGVKKGEVPCCSERGDVKGGDPSIPLRTGFAGVTNWAREAGVGAITVQVRVRDTMGGEVLLTQKNVEVFALASFPFSALVEFDEETGSIASRCALSNDGVFTPGSAEITCTNLVSTKNDLSETEICDGQVRFSWDKASQGFKQVSDCENLPRWTDHGDGTATDNRTGLMWELKTDDGSIHDKDNRYGWSTGAPWAPDGDAFTEFLGTLNGGSIDSEFKIGGCFANTCDWRLPTLPELTGILSDPECAALPCTTIPGESGDRYWSSTSCQTAVGTAVVKAFFPGQTNGLFCFDKDDTINNGVRAVRGGY